VNCIQESRSISVYPPIHLSFDSDVWSICFVLNQWQLIIFHNTSTDLKFFTCTFSDSSEMTTNIRSQIRALKSQERDHYWAIVENCADLFNAINWLPAGYLWAGKFTSRFCGGMGTISSAIKLYRIHSAKWNVS
jgi:hypothetical protein